MKRALGVGMLVLACGLGGCNYYAITDTETGETYYTRKIPANIGGRALVFRDAQTNEPVRVEEWEVQPLRRREYLRALGEDRRAAGGTTQDGMLLDDDRQAAR